MEFFRFSDGTLAAADLLPSVSITADQQGRAEGNGGATTLFTFTVRLSAASNAAQTVEFRGFGSGTDPADASDFAGGAAPYGVLAFAPGETSKTITVGVAGDARVEADEAFTVGLVNPSPGLVIGTGSASATVLNDDAAPRPTVDLSALTPGQIEGNGGTTAFSFTAKLSFASTTAQSVAWRVSGGQLNPTDAADFTGPLSGALVFAPGETAKTITVGVAGDVTVETDDTFVVALSDPSSGLLAGQPWALATVLNDDRAQPPPPVHVSEAQIAAYMAIADSMVHDLIDRGVWHA